MDGGLVRENVVDARIKKVLNTRTDSVTMLESLDAISSFFGKKGNNVEARRALRQDLELQNIQVAKKFLAEFDDVRNTVLSVDTNVRRIEQECQTMSENISRANENMKNFMQKASMLEERRNFYLKQSSDIESFLNRFQLSSEEIDEIHNSPISNSATNGFFNSLTRLRQAYNDCKLMIEQYQYNAGFELLDILGRHQSVGYQRLFEWVKMKSENISVDSSESDDVVLQLAVCYLREIPSYFVQCQDLVVSSRRYLLVQRFVVAVTQGSEELSVGTTASRAIEVTGRDANHYVSDMLAWIHQVIASEEEFLRAVFFSSKAKQYTNNLLIAQDDHGKEANLENGTVKSDELLSLEELLARCVHGLGRPLRVRIMQTLENRVHTIEEVYAISDLLYFYSSTFKKILPVENSVQSCVGECLEECRTIFSRMLSKYSENLLNSNVASFAVDTLATPSCKECGKIITEVLRVHNSSLSSLMFEDKNEVFNIEHVLGSIIHPLLQASRTCGNNMFQEKGDMALFMLNNVALVKRCLANSTGEGGTCVGVTSTWIDTLTTEISTWMDVLVAEETQRILQRSDMDKISELMEVLPQDMIASEQPGLTPDRVSDSLRAFYSSLCSTGTPLLGNLHDSDLRDQAQNLTAIKISSSYAQVYDMIMQPKNKYDAKLLLTHSVSDVKVLLGLSST
mmetsp:Transcript_10088/g.15282  ORF Transcript_10088/g.15282 Transcript_10088/m.15282 type:complete len:682 (-) Transcript_10088:85-2130(-)